MYHLWRNEMYRLGDNAQKSYVVHRRLTSKLAGGEQHLMLFPDGKPTGDSRSSGARRCSHLDGTK